MCGHLKATSKIFVTLCTHFALALHGVGLELKGGQRLLTLNPSSWQEQLRFMVIAQCKDHVFAHMAISTSKRG